MRISHVLAFLLCVSFIGCATDEYDDDDAPDDGTSMTEQELSSNQHAAFNYFVAKGLTKKQAAGIVGNLIQESSVIPTAKEFGGGPGRGIAQWSVGGRWNASHHDNMTWYASQHGLNRWKLTPQLAFIWYELHTVGGYGLTALRRTKTIKGATIAFERDFEKCGTCAQTKRINYAIQVYNAFKGSARELPDTLEDEALDEQNLAIDEETTELE